MPFELKVNMKLAPERRALPLQSDAKDTFDEEFGKQVKKKHFSLSMGLEVGIRGLLGLGHMTACVWKVNALCSQSYCTIKSLQEMTTVA